MKFTISHCLLLLALVLVAPAYSQEPSRKDPVVVDEKTEAVIRGALKWLAAKQNPNGSWAMADEEQRHPIAITGYTLMAFQAAGQLPGEGEYGKNVLLGMQFLLDSTAPDGLMGNRNDGQYMYGHGIATIALAELYGQTRSPAIRPKLERIIKVILTSQNNEGGWRYRPVAREADVSVTVLQVVALRAAKNAGLNVPQATIDNAVKYVKKCQDAATGGFNYQPGNNQPGFSRTAAAVYSLQVCGLYDDPMVKRGADYILAHAKERDQWFTYGAYYAAPAMYMLGDQKWRDWYGQISDLLLKNATTNGEETHWEPILDQGRSVGPVYCTAVYTMILAMPYHYVPLYQR